jgi:hypothetical protein
MRPDMKARLLLLLILALAFAPGCGGTPPSKEANPAVAREALATTLKAWKDGEKPDALAARTPPIRVADEDWLAGLRLEDFQVDPADRMIGTSLNCPVSLTLKNTTGKTLKKKAVYSVSTDPALTVIRQEGP